MRILVVFLMGLVLAACATTENGADRQSSTPEQWEVPLNDEEKRHIAKVEADGELLFRKDQYAARATRLLLDAVDLADYPNFVGWVGYDNDQDYIVSFYERDDNEVTLVADVHFRHEGSSHVEPNPDRSIEEHEVSMLNARMAALEAGANSCSARFNTVVMPAENDDDSWLVYVLSATTDPNLIVVGGHARVRVARETAKVSDVESLSNSCLTIDKSALERPGMEGGIVVVTHVVTPMPVPIHTFLSLLHDRPIFVVSERGRWTVSGNTISML